MNIDPHEWERQERALREDPAWREVARALRRSPGEPPAGFAAAVAARATTARAWRLERVFVHVSSAALAFSGVYVLWRLRGDWLPGLRESFGAATAMLGGPGALDWALAAGACLALSWGVARAMPRLPRAAR